MSPTEGRLRPARIGVLYPNLDSSRDFVKVNTGPADLNPIEQVQLRRFDGQKWVRFGELLGE